LKLGDTIALVRPAGYLSDDLFLKTTQTLRSFGFCVVTYKEAFKPDGTFSASDDLRARELQWAFSQPGVSLVWACRGGYGSVRTLSRLSKSDVRAWQPKIFVGYSDTTYLHQVLKNELGMPSIHGPLCGFLNRAQLKSSIRALLELPASPQGQTWAEIENLGRNVRVQGQLLGGNLSMIQTAGRAALPKTPMILAIEDVNEDFYRLDRMIWTLIDAGYAPFVKGIIVGSLLKCSERSFGRQRFIQTLQTLTNGPIWMKARFGHGLKTQRLLPLGCRVALGKHKRFEILEPVVVP
jgi:muramoyltetrapeptide carboxypeptidase